MAGERIEFFVPMKPVGKGRPRATRTGRIYTPKTTVEAERTIRAAAEAVAVPALDGPLRMSIRAEFAPPKSWTKRRRAEAIGAPHISTPDGDNILKLVGDALNGVAYSDDRLIAEQAIVKRYAAHDGITVIIREAV